MTMTDIMRMGSDLRSSLTVEQRRAIGRELARNGYGVDDIMVALAMPRAEARSIVFGRPQ
jgi:hypothetical protein